MKLTTGQSSGRAQYYDRNPTNVIKSLRTAALAPHTTTQRWSYTVPAARKAYIGGAQSSVDRVTAAAPAALSFNTIQVTPNGGSLTDWLDALIEGNNVDSRADIASSGGFMGAGDVIQSEDFDNSTGGTIQYFGSAMITEFDA